MGRPYLCMKPWSYLWDVFYCSSFHMNMDFRSNTTEYVYINITIIEMGEGEREGRGGEEGRERRREGRERREREEGGRREMQDSLNK